MNRRSFFGFACGGVVAAAAAPFAKPALAEAIYITPFGSSLSCGVRAVEVVDFGQSLYVGDGIRNPARQFQAIFEQTFGVDEANTVIFDATAAYCDELIEVEA